MSSRSIALLALAILAVSSAAVLVRWGRPEPLTLAFWRTAGGAALLGLAAARSPVRPRGRQWWWLAAAGLALGLHFATWLASLSYTSVAASVTLVCSSPLFIAAYLTITGQPPSRRTWASVGLATLGVATILAGDALSRGPIGPSSDRSALFGDGLALAGAVLVAVYFVIGQHLRTHLPTVVYSGWTYTFAALALAPVALISNVAFIGFDRRVWLVIAATIAGPQLAGHTVLNGLLKQLGSVTVSLALLLEPFASSLLVWLLFAEVPPLAVAVGAPLVIAGLALQLLYDRPTTTP